MLLDWLIPRGRGQRTREPWPLDLPLLSLGGADVWALRSAVEGTLVCGATGSGKSSGPASAIRRAMLSAGFGGVVFTVKNSEREEWQAACAETNRLDDLRIFSPSEPLRFSFLDYERTRAGRGAGLTANIVALFGEIMEFSQRDAGGSGGKDDDRYWRQTLRQLLSNLIDLCLLSDTPSTVPNLYRIAISAPTSLEQLASVEWRQRSFCMSCLAQADAASHSPSEKRDFELVADYWTLEWPNLSEKTRSIVLSCFTSLADALNRGVLRDLFCGETNITPDEIENGRIILIDMPVKEFGQVGRLAQILWKTAVQRSIERRDVRNSPRPVFLFMDEAQHFVSSQDALFQTTCRASRVATVMLTQNVSNFYAALGGGDQGKAEAESLFGNLNTKIFCASGDPVTNEWAASLIGRTKQVFVSGNVSRTSDWFNSMLGLQEEGQQSSGFNEAYEFEVQPSVFTRLRSGGPRCDNEVDTIIVRNGNVFASNGRVWKPVTFRQQ